METPSIAKVSRDFAALIVTTILMTLLPLVAEDRESTKTLVLFGVFFALTLIWASSFMSGFLKVLVAAIKDRD